MATNGHWFCDDCDDVIFMSYEKRHLSNVVCPHCGNFSCNFIPAKISRNRLPVEWFAEMRRIVSEAGTPELFDQRSHKELL
jgi:hypothetical protein